MMRLEEQNIFSVKQMNTKQSRVFSAIKDTQGSFLQSMNHVSKRRCKSPFMNLWKEVVLLGKNKNN